MQNINKLLSNLDQNQLREINQFLNSTQGRAVKNRINSSNKEQLLREFSKLDQNVVNSKLKSMSSNDLIKIIKNL